MTSTALGSDELLYLGDIAPELGVAPAALFAAGVRGELELVRGDRGHLCRRWEATVWARLQTVEPGAGQ